MRLVALLIFCVLPLPVLADDAAGNPTSVDRVTVPNGIPVQLDGYVNPSEWRDAAALELGAGVTLRMKQVRGTLLLAFEPRRPWPDKAKLLLYLGSNDAPNGIETPGTLRLDYEPREHDRPHLIVRRAEVPVSLRVRGRVAARHRAPNGVGTVEIAIPGDVLPEGPLRLVAQWAVPGQRGGARWPQSIDLQSKGRGLPPNLATGASWGHLDGFVRDGPGAYTQAEWTAWRDADNALEDKGDTAHSYVRLLIEEWRKLAKDDKKFDEEFFAPMQWIRQREALSLDDMHAQARVLHWLNRREEALGLFEGLAAASPRLRKSTAGSRARLFESMHRFDDAANMWLSIAKRPGLRGVFAKSFEAHAGRAMRNGDAWKQERALRKQAEAAKDQPLLLLRTSRGNAVMVLHQDRAPKAVAHFLSFVNEGAYEGTFFHKVHGDALAQGGALASKVHGCDFTGAEHAAVSVRRIPAETNGAHTFFRGALVLVKHPSQQHDSEFFFVTGAHPEWRKDGHVIIGHVLSGLDTIDELARCDLIEAIRVLK